MKVSFPFLFWEICQCRPWEKCCQQCFGEPGEPLGLSQGADPAWSLASTSTWAVLPFHQPPPGLVSTAGTTKSGDFQTLCTEEQVCFWKLGSLGLICN